MKTKRTYSLSEIISISLILCFFGIIIGILITESFYLNKLNTVGEDTCKSNNLSFDNFTYEYGKYVLHCKEKPKTMKIVLTNDNGTVNCGVILK